MRGSSIDGGWLEEIRRRGEQLQASILPRSGENLVTIQGSVRVGWESRLHEGSILIQALPCVRLLPNRSKIKDVRQQR